MENLNQDKRNPIFVTRPDLPPLEEFLTFLQKIWDTRVLSNGGPFHQELESQLSNYLGVPYISIFNNGTIALLTAIKTLEIKGEVITTPFSFVATAHALLWSGIKPVFVDIDPLTLNLNPDKIELAITPNTTAILPVHCYGNSCDAEAIKEIAKKYKLKIIYDAAHAFGVRDEGGSILRYGDLSVLSFHATKVFNTIEGGAIISPDFETKCKVDRLKNFGFVSEIEVEDVGINGKMNELQAAFGIIQLKYINELIFRRELIASCYKNKLDQVEGVSVLQSKKGLINNYSYFPILIGKDYPLTRDQLYEKLKFEGIFARRYFYPLISKFPMYKLFSSSHKDNLPVATRIANQIICLPIYPDLSKDTVEKIINLIKEN